jgi:hypothetical protein
MTSFQGFQKIFGESGGKSLRYIQVLDAASYMKPISTIQDCLPPRTDIVRHFALDSDDRKKPNHAFMEFKQLILPRRMNNKSQSKKSRGKAPRHMKKDDAAGWAHLIEAQQYTYHPMLIELKLAHKGLMESVRHEDTDGALPDDANGQALAQVAEWCELLEQGRNSHSRRVKMVLGTVRQQIDTWPNDSFIIVDERV